MSLLNVDSLKAVSGDTILIQSNLEMAPGKTFNGMGTGTVSIVNFTGATTVAVGSSYAMSFSASTSLASLGVSIVEFYVTRPDGVVDVVTANASTGSASYTLPGTYVTGFAGESIHVRLRAKDSNNNFSPYSDKTVDLIEINVNAPTVTVANSTGVAKDGIIVTVGGISLSGTGLSGSYYIGESKRIDWEVMSQPNGTGTKLAYGYNIPSGAVATIYVPNISALEKNTTYYVRARHCDIAYGNGAWGEASFTTLQIAFSPSFPSVVTGNQVLSVPFVNKSNATSYTATSSLIGIQPVISGSTLTYTVPLLAAGSFTITVSAGGFSDTYYLQVVELSAPVIMGVSSNLGIIGNEFTVQGITTPFATAAPTHLTWELFSDPTCNQRVWTSGEVSIGTVTSGAATQTLTFSPPITHTTPIQMGGTYYLKVKWKDSTYGYSPLSNAFTLTMLNIKSSGVTALSAYEGQSKAFSLDNTNITYTAEGATVSGTTVTYAAAVGATSGSFTVSAKGFTQTFTVTVQDVSVVTPTITVTGLNASNQITIYADVVVSSSDFAISPSAVTGVSDTLASAAWTLLDGTTSVWAGTGQTATIPATTFVFNKLYTLRLKHTGSKYGDSANADKAVTFKAFKITGRASVSMGASVVYTISGYNSSTGYTLSVSSWGGSVSSIGNDGKFTYTAGYTFGAYTLTVTAGGVSVENSVTIRPWNNIGVAGTQGFGVGIYPETLPAGLTGQSGHTDKTSSNYGNYTYSDGSVMVYIPKFYYRWGVSGITQTALYDLYGDNSIEIKPADFFENETEALEAGWGLHRAFIDGGAEKVGFWIDKYVVSNKDGVASSIKGGAPLCAYPGYYPYSSVTGNGQNPSNNAGGVFAVAKTRGNSFFPASIFQFNALAMLSLAHAQACKVNNNSTFCAWGDLGPISSTNPGNFPKSCNYYHTTDYYDQSVTFTPSATSLPFAGSGTPFEKTTHNGQTCGVSDFSGYQPAPGITSDRSYMYVLKRSVFMKDLTNSTTATNGAFGSAGRNANYDKVTGSVVSTPPYLIGDGNSRAFSNVYSSSSSPTATQVTHALSCAGIPLVTSNGGSAMFGTDATTTTPKIDDSFPTLFNWTHDTCYAGIWAANLNHCSAGSVSNIISASRCGFYP